MGNILDNTRVTLNGNDYKSGGFTLNSNTYKSSFYIDDLSINNEKIIEFLNLISKLIGLDIEYDDFKNMNESEIKSIIRDFNIKKIID